jgi:hypothetical protein
MAGPFTGAAAESVREQARLEQVFPGGNRRAMKRKIPVKSADFDHSILSSSMSIT